jgi:hypothetical protein
VTSYESLEDGRHALLHEPGRTCSEIMQSSHVSLVETLITTILSSQKIINIGLDIINFFKLKKFSMCHTILNTLLVSFVSTILGAFNSFINISTNRMTVICKQCVKLRTELLTNINVYIVTLFLLCMNVILHEGDLLSS